MDRGNRRRRFEKGKIPPNRINRRRREPPDGEDRSRPSTDSRRRGRREEPERRSSNSRGSGSSRGSRGSSSSSSSRKKYSVNDFKMKRILGFGAFSQVRKCVLHQTGRVYAVKVIPKALVLKKKKTRHVTSEKKALIVLKNHPLICKLKCTFQDRRCLYFVLEYVPNGELFSMWKKHGSFSLDATKFYCAQLLDIMQYIHRCGVVHMDLKPENLILDEKYNLKLVDFGTCLFVNDEETRGLNVLGTPEYTAPELIQRPADQPITFSVDYWSFGVIIYQLLAGKHPFKSGSNYLLFQKIIKLNYEFPENFPEVARDLVTKLLIINPEERLGYKDPKEIRKHAFFSDLDIDQIARGEVTPPKFSSREVKISPPTPSDDDESSDTFSSSTSKSSTTTTTTIKTVKKENQKNQKKKKSNIRSKEEDEEDEGEDEDEEVNE